LIATLKCLLIEKVSFDEYVLVLILLGQVDIVHCNFDFHFLKSFLTPWGLCKITSRFGNLFNEEKSAAMIGKEG